jgi:AraC family transcriptional regulator
LHVNAPVAFEMLQSSPLLLDQRGGDAAVTAGAVARLLRAGLQALEVDREAAAEIIAKACAVLEVAAAVGGASDPASQATVSGGLTPWQIQRIQAYVEENLNRNVSVTELANVVHLGPSHFRRAFKRCLGVSPHAYIIERRVRRAQELMLATDLPLSEIALQVGFADQAHLTTRFHRRIGKTPGAWRREGGRGGKMSATLQGSGFFNDARRVAV